MIYIGSDHGGLELKEHIVAYLIENSIEHEDLGTYSKDSCDYPDIAFKVAEKIGAGDLGILMCGTGIGMCIAANKVNGIRAALCHNEYTAEMARRHNNANILCLGGRVLEKELGIKIVEIFLNTEFEAGRHERRVDKIMQYGC